jgi:hypothetical protein
LRRAERLARRGGREKSALNQLEALHHVEEAVRTFLERELLALLHESGLPRLAPIEVGTIHLATNRVRFELVARSSDIPSAGRSVWVDLEERRGWLAAGVSEPGWLDGLEPAERLKLDEALLGLFKMSGVAVVHTPGASLLEPHAEPAPAAAHGIENGSPAATPAQVFAKVDVPWTTWVDVWETDEAISGPTSPLPSVLPIPVQRAERPARPREERVPS